MAINPNWPLLMVDWAPFWNCNGASFPDDRYAEVTSRTRGSASIQRGRQFELDQVRAGTFDGALANNDGAFDPLNTGGPWYGHIMPYQPARVRAQWPPTVNLLSQAQASGGDSGGYALGNCRGQYQLGVFSGTDANYGQIVTDATAWQGNRVFQFSVPNATASGAAIAYQWQAGAERLTTYTLQMRVRNITPSTSIQVQPYISAGDSSGTPTRTFGGTVTLTGSATAAWTLVTVTATLPSSTAYLATALATAATTSGAISVQVDGWQLEKASSATAWTLPGAWYPMYAGWMERYPSSWTLSGTYGLVQPTATDSFSLFSQRILRDPLTEEIYRHTPRFLYTLGDSQGSSTFTDAIGAYPPAPLAVSKYGAGSFIGGTQITSATAGGGYIGSTGTVATIANPSPGQGVTAAATFLSLSSVGIIGPAAPSGSWSRMIAFRYTAGTPAAGATIWSNFDSQRVGGVPSGSRIIWSLDSLGKFNIAISGPGGSVSAYAPGPACADGNWHLAFASYSHTTATLIVNLDGSSAFWTGYSAANEPTGLVSDNVGAYVDPTVGNGTTFNWQGDLSFACEWPTALSSSDMTTIYNAWRTSFSGDSTDARYGRILGWAGYNGPTSIQAGLTTSMGPAATGGQDALSALQAVVDTESGSHYIDRAGTVVFKSRGARYNALTPTYTFGENTAGGEIPYEDLQLDFDPTRLANQIAVTQASTSQVLSAQDSTSITNFFPRQLSRTINSSSTQECQDAANYLLSRYKNPAVRVSSIKLHPSANPSVLWPVCLSLELGTRIRVMRRPPGAQPIQVDCFVETIQWDWNDQADAWVTLQCSPVDLTPYGVLAAWHTTLNASIASGVSSIVVKNAPGQDNTDPLAAQLSVGEQLTLGQGTGNAETVTISAIGASSPGWTTCTITLTAATTKAHTAGDTVCDVLPAGYTDPTTWDAVSALDAHALAY